MFRFQIGPRCSDKTGGGSRGGEREREGEGGEKCGAVTRFPIETERSLTGRRDRFTEP